MFDPSIPIVFLAGLISFFAPCFVPLLPVYVSTLTGLSVQQLQQAKTKSSEWRILWSSALFILGFSFVFVALGLSASAIGRFFISNRILFSQLSGLVLIVFGLFMLGILRSTPLGSRQFGITVPKSLIRFHFLGPIFMGITFGFAWTPCVGPILGSVLTLAANSASLQEGVKLLLVYSLGISLPFLLVSLFMHRALSWINRVRGFLGILAILGGVFTILLGVLLLLGQYITIVGPITSHFYPPFLYNFILGSV